MNLPTYSPPPQWPLKVLRLFLKESYLEEIEGDMEEIFQENLANSSEKKARRLYAIDTLKLLRPVLIKSIKLPKHLIHYSMFKHNFTIAFRNFARHKTSFLINLIGLATGLACFLLIYLWVQDEWRMDKFHVYDDQLYQLWEHSIQNNSISTTTNTSGPAGPALLDEMPEVELAVTARTKSINPNTLNTDKINLKAKGLFASKDFFELFSFRLIEGTADKALADHGSIAISEDLATKFFGRIHNVVGEKIEIQHEWPYLVSAVFKKPPAHSSLQFDYVTSYEAWSEEHSWVNYWQNTHPQTFIRLKTGTNINDFNAKIADIISVKTEGEDAHRTLFATKYSDNYLYGNYENGKQAGGRIDYVWLFSIIAVFILLIACINFMNLSTAKATRRLKEVGIKKSLGARRISLVFQYLSESTLLAFISLVFALTLVWFFLPTFNEITGKEISLVWDISMLQLLGVTVLFTGLLAGSYPAIYLSGLDPIATIKGKLRRAHGELFVRRGLVVLQYSLSIILMVSVWVVYKQIEFTQTQHLGYERANVIRFDREGRLRNTDDTAVFLQEVSKIPGVRYTSSIGNNMTSSNYATNGISWPGKDPADRTVFEIMEIDYDMIELLGMEMVEGRSYSEAFGADSSKLIFNEAAIRYMGMNDPIGKTVQWGQDDELEIIGVVKDFHFESFHESIRPLVFFLGEEGNNIMIKIENKALSQTLPQIEEKYQELNPGFTLDYKFLDEEYEALYVAENRVSILSRYFAGLAILISCLGLFGLAMFTAAKRQKEIGIRKVLGASTFHLVRRLSDDFTKMVGIAILIALPISYVLIKNWLGTFAFSISLQWWYFVGIGILAMLIAWLTVGFQTARSASVNPVECLRDE